MTHSTRIVDLLIGKSLERRFKRVARKENFGLPLVYGRRKGRKHGAKAK